MLLESRKKTFKIIIYKPTVSLCLSYLYEVGDIIHISAERERLAELTMSHSKSVEELGIEFINLDSLFWGVLASLKSMGV